MWTAYPLSSSAAGWRQTPEARFLPEYCNPAQDPAIDRKWRQILGKGIIWLNHYCHSLVRLQRCNRLIGEEQKQCLVSAVKGFRYVDEHVADNFALLPQIGVQLGRVLRRIGEDGEAVVEFQKAIRRNPRYSRAYMALADYYRDRGDIAEALRVVEQGLQHNPKSKGLNRRKKELEELLKKQPRPSD